MRKLHASGGVEQETSRSFPRWQEHRRPRCPKHPSRTMRPEKQKMPGCAAAGHLKLGTRVIWYCRVEGCHMVSLGEHEIYRGESIKGIGSLDGVW